MCCFWKRILLAASCAGALIADPLPKLETETLSGKSVTLPEAAKGRPTLLIIGFSHGSRVETKAWNDRVPGEFGDKLGVYTIVVLQDSPKLVRMRAVRGVKSSTPAERRERTLLVYHYEKELKIICDFGRPDDAYLLLLDGNSEILWKSHGPPTDDGMQKIKALLP